MELVIKDKEYIDLVLSGIKRDNSLSRLSNTNRRSLKEMVKYLSSLNKQDLINDQQLSELISLACANYIENEIELRLDNMINDKLMNIFEKFLEVSSYVHINLT